MYAVMPDGSIIHIYSDNHIREIRYEARKRCMWDRHHNGLPVDEFAMKQAEEDAVANDNTVTFKNYNHFRHAIQDALGAFEDGAKAFVYNSIYKGVIDEDKFMGTWMGRSARTKRKAII